MYIAIEDFIVASRSGIFLLNDLGQAGQAKAD